MGRAACFIACGLRWNAQLGLARCLWAALTCAEAHSTATPLGNEEPWPWVWSQKPSIGSVIVVAGSGAAAASKLREVCTARDPLLTRVIAVGDEDLHVVCASALCLDLLQLLPVPAGERVCE